MKNLAWNLIIDEDRRHERHESEKQKIKNPCWRPRLFYDLIQPSSYRDQIASIKLVSPKVS